MAGFMVSDGTAPEATSASQTALHWTMKQLHYRLSLSDMLTFTFVYICSRSVSYIPPAMPFIAIILMVTRDRILSLAFPSWCEATAEHSHGLFMSYTFILDDRTATRKGPLQDESFSHVGEVWCLEMEATFSAFSLHSKMFSLDFDP